MWPDIGYWNPNEQTVPVPCSAPADSRCLGGQGSPCGTGYQGTKCANCSSGYEVDASTGACVTCPSTGCSTTSAPATAGFTGGDAAAIIIVLLVVAGLGVAGFFLYRRYSAKYAPRLPFFLLFFLSFLFDDDNNDLSFFFTSRRGMATLKDQSNPDLVSNSRGTSVELTEAGKRSADKDVVAGGSGLPSFWSEPISRPKPRQGSQSPSPLPVVDPPAYAPTPEVVPVPESAPNARPPQVALPAPILPPVIAAPVPIPATAQTPVPVSAFQVDFRHRERRLRKEVEGDCLERIQLFLHSRYALTPYTCFVPLFSHDE